MEVSADATVRSWDDELGWGVLDSDATPGGCWTHLSVLDFDGYRSLAPGQAVRLRAEFAEQNGFSWRAVHVSVDGKAPATPSDPDAGGAYTSSRRIIWDDTK